MNYPNQISNPPSTNWAVQVNENLDAMAHQGVYGYDVATSVSALTWGYFGGRWGGFSVAAGTLTLTNAATNYIVVLKSTGAISISTSGTNWASALYAHVYIVTTAGGVVTAVEDHRAGPSGVHGGGSVTGAGDALVANPLSQFAATTSAQLAGVLSDETGSGAAVFATSPTLVTPALGTPSALVLTNATGLPVAGGGTGVATLTAYAPIFGGTTGTGAVQSGTVGTSGHVLTSNGASALPTFQAAGGLADDSVTNAKLANVATQTIKGRTTASTGDPEDLTPAQARAVMQVGMTVIAIACSDELTALTAGTNKVKFINPFSTVFNIAAVVASLSTAQTSGSIFTVDINEAGTTLLSTKLTIDNTETNSSTAATPAVISDAAVAAFAEIGVDIDQVGDGTANGLKVYLIGYPS